MRNVHMIVAAISAICLLVVGGLAVPGRAGDTGAVLGDGNSAPDMGLMYGGSGSAYSDCQQDCRSQFGLDPYADIQFRGGGGGSFSGYYAYAACIQKCTTEHWKRFDREMDEVEKGR
jgi:hypothetical protein